MNSEIEKVAENIRAMLHVVNGLEVLKQNSGSWRESLLIDMTLALYRHRLDKARQTISPNIWAEIEREIGDVLAVEVHRIPT